MSFLYPIFIYTMLPIVLIIFYFIFTGSKKNFEMFDKDVLERLRFENNSLGLNARYALFLTAFILMIFALAQPVIKDGEIKVAAKSADILIALDISDSMKAQDRYPNRLEFAKAKAIELIKIAPQNRIGVIAFAKSNYIVSPLSFDHSSVAFLLSKVKTGSITEKGTYLDSVLKSSISMLEHSSEKNILLFTDGGDNKDFSKEIKLAKENNLRVFVMAVATSKGSPVKDTNGEFIKHNGNILISKLNPELKNLATQTGGVYIEAVLGDDDIKTMLKEIESITTKSTLKEESIPQYIQLFYYPLALAIFFLLLAFSSFPRKIAKNFVLLAFVSLGYEDAKAGVLDFNELQKAKEAYKNKEFKKSASIYKDFAIDSEEAVYNLANSLYKDKEYERAIKVYDEIKNTQLRAKALYNKANAQVQLGKYEEALKSYEESLKIKEDKEALDNYEALKKFLQKKKEQEKKEQEKDSQNKDKSDKDKKSDENKSKEKSDKNKSPNKDSKDEQKSDKKESPSKKKSDSKDEVKKPKDEKANKKADEKESLKEEKTSKEQTDKNISVTSKQMSELEAKKWLKIIQNSQKGHLYKMENAGHEEDENEKPW